MTLAAGDSGVLLDQFGHNTAQSLDTEREWRNIKEQNILDVAGENAALDAGADSNYLVGVDSLVGDLAKNRLNLC